MCGTGTPVIGQKESVHPALAEANSRPRERQWRNTDYLILNGSTQENGKFLSKSWHSLVVCRLQIIWKITRHCGLGVWGHDGSSLVGSEVRVRSHFSRS